MKKVLSILLSIVMIFSVFSASTIAYAKKNPIYSPETTVKHIHITVTLNGESSNKTEYVQDKENDRIITFTYTGDGVLIGWEFDYNNEGLVEGVDYIVISQDENSITIEILGDYSGENFWVNAIDKHPDETTSESSESTTETTTGKRNDSQKSPDTGASALGLGIMLAGSAILVASRKKHE